MTGSPAIDTPPRIARIKRAADWLLVVSLFVWPLAVVPFILGARLVTLGATKSGALRMVESTALLGLGVVLALVMFGTDWRKDSPTPTVGSAQVQQFIRGDAERWLTNNTPAGVSAHMSRASCDDLGQGVFKCAVYGVLRGADGASERGHVTIVVTVKDNRTYTTEPREFWTAS